MSKAAVVTLLVAVNAFASPVLAQESTKAAPQPVQPYPGALLPRLVAEAEARKETAAEDEKVAAEKKAAPLRQDATFREPDLRSVMLMRYGVTLGAGLAVHLPNGGTTKSAAPAVLGHVTIMPGWLAMDGDVTKYYCAARRNGDDWQTAKHKADDYAKGLARQRLARPSSAACSRPRSRSG